MLRKLPCSLTNAVKFPNYFYDGIIILKPKHDKGITEENYRLISFVNINRKILNEI